MTRKIPVSTPAPRPKTIIEHSALTPPARILAQWFVGSSDPGDIRLTSGGAQFTASIGAAGGRGELALDDGLILPFELSRVDGEAGLYRAEETIAAAEIRGGWIVLPDGSQRGAVLSGTSIVSTQPLDLTTSTATVPGIGTLQAVRLRPPNSGLGGFQFGS